MSINKKTNDPKRNLNESIAHLTKRKNYYKQLHFQSKTREREKIDETDKLSKLIEKTKKGIYRTIYLVNEAIDIKALDNEYLKVHKIDKSKIKILKIDSLISLINNALSQHNDR